MDAEIVSCWVDLFGNIARIAFEDLEREKENGAGARRRRRKDALVSVGDVGRVADDDRVVGEILNPCQSMHTYGQGDAPRE